MAAEVEAATAEVLLEREAMVLAAAGLEVAGMVASVGAAVVDTMPAVSADLAAAEARRPAMVVRAVGTLTLHTVEGALVWAALYSRVAALSRFRTRLAFSVTQLGMLPPQVAATTAIAVRV